MSDHIARVREQAESEAERLWPTYPNGEAARITDPACWVKRKAYVRGQVALASRLTRESIAEALLDVQSVDVPSIVILGSEYQGDRADALVLADAVLELIGGETDAVS